MQDSKLEGPAPRRETNIDLAEMRLKGGGKWLT